MAMARARPTATEETLGTLRMPARAPLMHCPLTLGGHPSRYTRLQTSSEARDQRHALDVWQAANLPPLNLDWLRPAYGLKGALSEAARNEAALFQASARAATVATEAVAAAARL
uniref:Uncharacterized protein n=1 Tax=Haptolina brevifila TaxID=156173 RepID=A0A7S2NQE0_9EUKA